ncbi:MAG: methyltransferase domain-containing protein [Bacteroidota bacterium]
MSPFDLIIDLHQGTERQGPGSQAATLKALACIDLPKGQPLTMADIGCGTGGQTITLAQQLEGQITAVDLMPPFLEELNKRAKALGLAGKITTLECSMTELPFEPESLDLIWSEGAIYNIGFAAGIQRWGDYLKPGGYLAVSEITWISETRPQEIEDYWNQAYPKIDRASGKIKVLEDQGYSLAGYFYLAPDDWLDTYYHPLETSFPAFLERQAHSKMAQQVIEEYQKEIELYRRFKAYFSYGFYIAKKY